MRRQDENLNLMFYEASDGPRVVLFGSLTCRIDKLAGVFRRLSQGEGPFDLHLLPFIRAFAGTRVRAARWAPRSEGLRGVGQGLNRIASQTGEEFEWCLTADDWENFAELLGPLADSRDPGHQYLNACPHDDAIVVVSKGEYGEEILEGLTRD